MKTLRPNWVRPFLPDQKEQIPNSLSGHMRGQQPSTPRGLRKEEAPPRLAGTGILCAHLSEHVQSLLA